MTADEYFQCAVPEVRQGVMKALRQLIRKNLPGADETMAYKLPTYVVDGEALVSLASQKHYISLYICHYDLLEPFREPLSAYDCGKSCIRFKSADEEDMALFGEVIRYVRDHIHESTLKGKSAV